MNLALACALGVVALAASAGGALAPPHGGSLVDLMATAARKADVLQAAASDSYPSWTLTPRQVCDIEMLLNGGFSPLTTFMDKATYTSVVSDMRLGSTSYNNEVWPMPITLDLPDSFVSSAGLASASPSSPVSVLLRDPFFNPVAVIHISELYVPDKVVEAKSVFGTTDMSHPAVDYLFHTAAGTYVSGTLEGIQLPAHFDFPEIRATPAELRAHLTSLGWNKTVAFQTRNPMHRAHIEVTRLAAEKVGAGVLIHPVVGMTKPGDVSYNVRVQCYKAIIGSGSYYAQGGVHLSLLPIAMRMAGPREALWHALIRQNYGASHFIVGRDHAGCKSSEGKDFYGPYDAQALVASVADELVVEIVPFQMVAYVPELDTYLPADRVPKGMETLAISGTKFRGMMASGADIPAWFSHPDVIRILQQVSPPLSRRGFAVFFTGLSGAGKTTIETALLQALSSALPTRAIEVLDGDVVRTHLSSKLGFSIEDRNTNVARVGYVASLVARHGGIGLVSNISPFEEGRRAAKRLVTAARGGYILVHVSTSLEVCAQRDVKGLYARAAAGTIKQFTGVSHPFENPEAPDLTIDAGTVSVGDSVRYIMGYLQHLGYLSSDVYDAGFDRTAEQALTDAGVLTASEVDVTARLCAAAAPRVVVATGGVDALKAVSKKATASVTLTASDVARAERAVLGGLGVPAFGVKAAGSLADSAASTGTTLTSPLTEAQRVEVGFEILRAAWARAKDAKQPLLVLAPRVVPYVESMLRVDPCLKVAVLADAEETDSAVADMRAEGLALARARPDRVQVYSGGKSGAAALLDNL